MKRGVVSLGDVVRALEGLHPADDETRAALAQLLGYELRPAVSVEESRTTRKKVLAAEQPVQEVDPAGAARLVERRFKIERMADETRPRPQPHVSDYYLRFLDDPPRMLMSSLDAALHGEFKLSLDFERLAKFETDPVEYGAALEPLLPLNIRNAVTRSPSRPIRLRLGCEHPAVRAASLERMLRPGSQMPLARRVRLSRFVPIENYNPAPWTGPPSVALCVASPLGLPPIDVERAAADMREALAGIEVRVFRGKVRDLYEASTSAAIVHVLAHATDKDGRPALFLEDENGSAVLMPASELTGYLREKPPRLFLWTYPGKGAALLRLRLEHHFSIG